MQALAALFLPARSRFSAAKTCAERPDPGARPEPVEAHPQRRGIGVIRCGDRRVMHPRMGRCVMTKKKRDVDGNAQPARPAIAAMDQLMRIGNSTPAQRKAPAPGAGHPGTGPRQRTARRQRPHAQRHQRQMRQPKPRV